MVDTIRLAALDASYPTLNASTEPAMTTSTPRSQIISITDIESQERQRGVRPQIA